MLMAVRCAVGQCFAVCVLHGGSQVKRERKAKPVKTEVANAVRCPDVPSNLAVHSAVASAQV